MASGNTARHHGLDVGFVEEGRPADLTLLGAPKGSDAETALEAVGAGSYPAVDKVLIDGEVLVERGRNSAPAKTPAELNRR